MQKNQLPIVLAVISNEAGEVLLTRRNDPGKPNEHGKLEFPGGKTKFGEDPLEAVVRETKEETGYDIEVERLLPRVYTKIFENTTEGYLTGDIQVFLIAYECKIVGGEFKPSDKEVLEGRFYKPSEINYSECLDLTKEIINLLANS